MPYQEIQALGFPYNPRKLRLHEKPRDCISFYGPWTKLVNSNHYNEAISGQLINQVGKHLDIVTRLGVTVKLHF